MCADNGTLHRGSLSMGQRIELRVVGWVVDCGVAHKLSPVIFLQYPAGLG